MSFQFVQDHRDYLRREFQARAQRRPLYSQRAFARDIGLSPSSLTDFLKGRMRLSTGRIAQVGDTLKLNSEQKQHWIDLMDAKFSRSIETRKISQVRARNRLQAQNESISLDHFKMVSEWFHMAYLELIDMNAAKYSDVKVAAAALGLPVRTLRVAVKRLEKQGLLRKSAEGLYSTDPSTLFGDGDPSFALRQFHIQILKKAIQSLEVHDRKDQRYNSSAIVALPRAEVDRILSDVRALDVTFLDPYLVRSKDQTKDSLFCFNINFFDLMTTKESAK
jgi:uncharacterized protein (TIGR02147 family)